MNKSIYKCLLPFLFLLNGLIATAQTGEYQVRVVESLIALDSMKYHVDIEVKANDATTVFSHADANYVLTFNKAAIDNPVINAEFTFSGTTTDSLGNISFFNPHDLNGSVDSFLVYNIVMAGGFGYYTSDTAWTPAGRISFDIIDPFAGPNLAWKTQNDWPPTNVLSKDGLGTLELANGRQYFGIANFGNALLAVNDSKELYEDSTLVFNPLFNDQGLPDLTSTLIVEGPDNGAASFANELLTYTPDFGYLGPDTIRYSVCEDGMPTVCDSAYIYLNIVIYAPPACTSTDCVWPGDTDNNAQVSHFDVLNIGLAKGATGPPRPDSSLNWTGQAAWDWNQATPVSNVNYKHIDTDGNGLIDLNDSMSIAFNWGEVYTPKQRPTSLGEIPFYLENVVANPGETIDIPLILGDSANPVINAYGLAFSLNYDETMVVPGSAIMLFDSSWLGTASVDLFDMQRDFPVVGRLDVGVSRFDGTPMPGYGQIGVLRITIKDDVLLTDDNVDLYITPENDYLINHYEQEILALSQNSYVTITKVVATSDPLLSLGLDVFPNPVSGLLQLQAKKQIKSLSISNVIGQEIYTATNLTGNTTIDTDDWPKGVYTITLREGKAVYTEKLVVY